MTNNEMLEKAISLATLHHQGQVRDNGEPFILHPIRVMCTVDSMEEKIVAILHDTLEDTNLTLEYVATFLNLSISDNKIQALKFISRNLYIDKDQDYLNYIRAIKKYSKLATVVKLADLKDNLDMITYNCSDTKKLSRCISHCKAYHTINESL